MFLGMISGIIPEGTNLRLVVSLPVVIHLGDEFHHLLMVPFLGSLHFLLILFLDLSGLLGWLCCIQRGAKPRLQPPTSSISSVMHDNL